MTLLGSAIEGSMKRAADERVVVPLSIAATFVVGVGDYLTGAETTFTLLYLFPLAFGTWLRGRSFGVVLAVVATVCAVCSELLSGHVPTRLPSLIWNQFASLITMLLVVWILTVLRVYVDQERSRRELAVEQLRHAERLNLIGQLAAGVAHELGTPLNVISGSAEMLDAVEANRANVSKYSSAILEQTRKMSAIIRHLLDFGRRGGSSRMSADLNDIVAHTVELLLPLARRQNRLLLVEPFERAVAVEVNPPEIEQVLSNLLMNAMQAMSPGGCARIRVSVGARETTQGTFRPFALVIVQDDGAGIDERDIPHVFDPFFTTKGVGEGTGLGLAVSYGIIRDHGGLIEVKSELGKGSSFSVLLPLATRRHRTEGRQTVRGPALVPRG